MVLFQVSWCRKETFSHLPPYLCDHFQYISPVTALHTIRLIYLSGTMVFIHSICPGFLFRRIFTIIRPIHCWWLSLMVMASVISMKLFCVVTVYLLLRWVTVCRYTVLACNQPLRPTQLPTLSGMENEYWKGSVVVLCGLEGNRRFNVTLGHVSQAP